MSNPEKNEVYNNSRNLIGHSQSQSTISVVINNAERTCQGIQSNLDIMPPIGTELDGIVTRAGPGVKGVWPPIDKLAPSPPINKLTLLKTAAFVLNFKL